MKGMKLMANTFSAKKKQIYNAALDAAKKVYTDIEIPEFVIEEPKDKNNGDFAVNVAMMLARAAKSAPRQRG